MKVQRHKEAEITKLRMELASKEAVIRRLIRDSRRTTLRWEFVACLVRGSRGREKKRRAGGLGTGGRGGGR